MFNLNKKNLGKIDLPLVISIIVCVIYGLLVLYSATMDLEKNHMIPQALGTIAGLFFAIFFIFLDLDIIKKFYIPIYLCSIALLVFVLFKGIGAEKWGANSWLRIGGIVFQPAEFAKIGLLISLARFIEINQKNINQPLTLLKILAFAFFPVALILKQPDAGTAMVFAFFIAVMLFTAGLDLKYIIPTAISGILAIPLAYLRLDQYQKDRILNWIFPDRDIANTGLQAYQGRVAIGSGKFTGRGLFKSLQGRFKYVPEVETDYIFAILCEELGFLGGFFLIMLYCIIMYRLILIAKRSKDLFGTLITVGFCSILLFHIFENIGMTIGVVPITGIPLPFFSYGGTFQMINLIAVGLVLSVTTQKQPLDFY